MAKWQKGVQNWQLCIICQLSKSQTVGLWMRLKISIGNAFLHRVGGCMGGKVPTGHKSSHRIKISQLVQDLFHSSDLIWPHPSPYPTTHPPIVVHSYVCVHTCMHDTPFYQYTPACPSPRPRGSKISKNWISLELIKIIWFCSKIYDLWILLHSYRLGLVCRRGCTIPHNIFIFQAPKKVHIICSCQAPGEMFLFSH